MKKICVEYRQAQRPNRRYFYNGSEVTRSQAKVIQEVGGTVLTERTDEWFWRNWS